MDIGMGNTLTETRSSIADSLLTMEKKGAICY